MNRPRLIVAEEHRRSGWNGLTWETRQGYRDRNGERVPVAQGMGMTAQELIKEMGSLHAQHPDFQPRPRSLLPIPNMTGKNGGVVECYDARWLAHFRRLFAWAMR